MNANLIQNFRRKIASDAEYRRSRRDFHENYEWIEAYWRERFDDVDQFCRMCGPRFWSLEEVRNSAREFALEECVGNSENPSYEQTREIAKATMYLRYRAGLWETEDKIPDCSTVGCRESKSVKGWCNEIMADQWTSGEHAAFKALVYIVRQIRNNMFHGHKLELESSQYDRNKRLLKIAATVTGVILDNLE